MVIPFDFEAFLLSIDVQGMNTIQVGAYTLLLGYCSVNKNKRGYIKNDMNLLRRITRMSEHEWVEYASDVLRKFEVDGDFIYNKRLLKAIDESYKSKPKRIKKSNFIKKDSIYNEAEEVINLIKVDESLVEPFVKWIKYKQKDKNFTYKTISSLQEAYNSLVRLSESNFELANEIVSFSMANGYQGMFKPNNKNFRYGTKREYDVAKARQIKDASSEILSWLNAESDS